MRKTALVVALLVVALCLFASGTERDTVKVYFTAGEIFNEDWGSQLWRCNRDGSEAELLVEGGALAGVAVDSETQKLFYWNGECLIVADLDGSNASQFDCSSMWMLGPVTGPAQVDTQGGYVCWVSEDGLWVRTALLDGSDSQTLDLQDIPGIVADPGVKGLALHVVEGAPVESTTWGQIKAKFR